MIVDMTNGRIAAEADRGTIVPPGYIYVLEAVGVGRYKIGKTLNARQRLTRHSTSSPVELRTVLVAMVTADILGQVETNIHNDLAAYRVKGEWFSLPEDVVRDLRTILAGAAQRPKRPPLSSLAQMFDDRRERRRRQEEMKAAAALYEAKQAVPVDDQILNVFSRIESDERRFVFMRDLTSLIDRKPQVIHQFVRDMIWSLEIALVNPLRNEAGGVWAEHVYRRCALCLPRPDAVKEVSCEGDRILVLRTDAAG